MVLFSIDLPPQGRLLSRPGGAPLAKILCRYRLLMEAVCGLIGPEDCADAPKKVVDHLEPFLGGALAG